MKKIVLFLLAISLCLNAIFSYTSCIEKEKTYKLKKKEFNNGDLYQLIDSDSDSIILDIGFFKDGDLNFVSNVPYGFEQVIYYHKKTGVIQSKLKIDSLDRISGRAYYFHDINGNLSSDYNFIDGVKIGSAVSYHDSTERVKAIMLYNEKGELFYKKSFDKYGNHIKTEGSKD